ncbi:hypothetical protein IQ277_35015 [Nostocales cyanobacterium LEGE 12452]|nr:hypothetical protein [Nostocales cyanobacterium LEGE 12452]
MTQALKTDNVIRDTGKFYLKKDTLIFPRPFFPIYGRKAVIKHGFLEFLDSTEPFKLQILRQEFVEGQNVDSLQVRDISIFTYTSKFYQSIFPNAIHYDLSNEELIEVNKLVGLCILENKDELSKQLESYDMQFVAVINQQKEKEVWVNCACKDEYSPNDYKYGLIDADDGGDCYFRVKVNLTKHIYHSLSVNGRA